MRVQLWSEKITHWSYGNSDFGLMIFGTSDFSRVFVANLALESTSRNHCSELNINQGEDESAKGSKSQLAKRQDHLSSRATLSRLCHAEQRDHQGDTNRSKWP